MNYVRNTMKNKTVEVIKKKSHAACDQDLQEKLHKENAPNLCQMEKVSHRKMTL